VNRLLQNLVDGKLVEVSAYNKMSNDDLVEESKSATSEEKQITSISMFNSKVQGINREYTAMLATTLENQRAFFESQLVEVERQVKEDIGLKEKTISLMDCELTDLDEEIARLSEEVDGARTKFEECKAEFSEAL